MRTVRWLPILTIIMFMGSPPFLGDQSQFNSTPFYSNRQDAASFLKLQNDRIVRIQNLIDRIGKVEGKRTIENTLQPYDDAFILVDSVAYESSVLRNVHPDAAIREAATKALSKASNYITELNVNSRIYQALSSLDLSEADVETAYYVKSLLEQMRARGALADAEKQARIKTLEEELLQLDQEFEKNMAEGSRTVVANVSELDGLPRSFLDQHRPNSEGKVVLNTDGSDYTAVMRNAKKDELRRKMYVESLSQAYPANLDVLQRMLVRRHELARLCGFANWATYKSVLSMMKSPTEIDRFLDQLVEPIRCAANRRNQILLEQKRQQDPSATLINPWEVTYLNNRVETTEKDDIDWAKVKEYFPYEATKLGIFHIFETIFGIQFRQRQGIPVWHSTVECWEIFESGKLIGRIYLDLCRRPEKFWEDVQYPVRTGIAGRQLAESVVICGFFDDAPNKTTFFSYRDAETLFHELGHSLHSIFASNHRWIGVAGARTEPDFKEAPSQLFEEWMHDTRILQTFARHYKSGEPIPEQLVRQIQRSTQFDQAKEVLDFLFYSKLSLKLHDADPADFKIPELVRDLTNRYSPYPYVEGTHVECSFQYLLSHTSEFYTYLLSQVIAKDFFSRFNGTNLLDSAPAMRFHSIVLAPGGAKPAKVLVENFLGRDFTTKPWEQWLSSVWQPIPDERR